MNERPILFSGEMVRAILDGRKTQTRRIVKGGFPNATPLAKLDYCRPDWQGPICPYGKSGDHLWVRETWRAHALYDELKPANFPMSASAFYKVSDNRTADTDIFPFGRWRPSIHMPRWASRIALEITNIRVERLQDISEEDSKAEGIEVPLGLKMLGEFYEQEGKTHRVAFKSLWDKINDKKYPWNSNPYVWVLEFTKI